MDLRLFPAGRARATMVPTRGDETVGTDGGGVPGEGVRAGARRDPVRIDGSLHSGSGSIVRQAAVLAALTGRPVTLANARIRRPHPGLRHQHVAVLEAVRALVGGDLTGATAGSRTFSFRPGAQRPAGRYDFDIATAGSATLLALAVLPLVSFRGDGVEIEIRGGLFQDFAPSLFHLQHVVLPTLAEMGLSARLEMLRPGYVPGGQGVLRLSVPPAPARLRPLVRPRAGAVRAVWGIAFASHLRDRRVTTRMAASAREVLSKAGIPAEIEERDDTSAAQAGATFALVAELEGGSRLGADRAGAPHRRAEEIGAEVARMLLEDLATGASVDRHAADQLLVFAALATGSSSYRIPAPTAHLDAAAWLAGLFLGAGVRLEGTLVSVDGCAASPGPCAPSPDVLSSGPRSPCR